MSLAPEFAERQELEGYIRRHEADHYAHAPMRHDFRDEMLGDFTDHNRRISKVETWLQRIIGGLILAGALIGGGAIATVIELTRHP